MENLRPTDAEIIRDSLERPDVFGEVFSRHFVAVFRFAARRVGLDDAGEVASEVFATAYRIRTRYDRSRSNCLPWLYGIAANVVGDRLRRRQRGTRVFLAVSSLTFFRDETTDLDDRILAESVGERVNEALSRLSRRDRETLLLYALEDLSYSEIAEALGIPEGTVGSRISRARRQIREQIPDLEQIADRMNKRPGTEGQNNG